MPIAIDELTESELVDLNHRIVARLDPFASAPPYPQRHVTTLCEDSRMFHQITARPAAGPLAALAFIVAATLACAVASASGWEDIAWTPAEKPLATEVYGMRGLPDAEQGPAMRKLALEVRRLPASPNKLRLADQLGSASTEGEFGRDTLQQVAITLEEALRENPVPWSEPNSATDPSSDARLPPYGYRKLASLALYDHVRVTLTNDVHYQAALAALKASTAKRAHANFTLTDLHGKTWTLTALRGKVVLVNFWATWCPPCRKEIPDLEALYTKFSPQGLVILGITDEEADKVAPFVRQHGISYPVLLDPPKAAQEAFDFHGIPKSFVFDRSGKLVAEAMDMRTQNQFLAMLRSAGLQ